MFRDESLLLRIVAGVETSTEMYLAREVDERMIRVITEHLSAIGTVLDAGCGSGQYGEHLREIAGPVTGFDVDAALVAAAAARGTYEMVHQIPVLRARELGNFEAVFCSEMLEHLPNNDLRPALDALEDVAHQRMLITVPHPRAPHFKLDPTHVLRYSVRSFRDELNRSTKFRYRALGIGFHGKFQQHPMIRLCEPIARRNVYLSPTMLFVGVPR